MEDTTLCRQNITIEFPSPTSGNEALVTSDVTQINETFLYEGTKDLPGLLTHGVPLMKNLIEKTRNKWKTAVSNERQGICKELFAEDEVAELEDRLDLFHAHFRRYGNKLPKVIKETEIFQGKFGEQLKRVKSVILKDRPISSMSFKIWVNGAAFHIEMLIRLAQLTTEEDSHSVRQAILLYQEDLQQVIKCYGMESREDDIVNCILLWPFFPLADIELRTKKYIDEQFSEIQQHFSRLLDRVDSLVKPDRIGAAGERTITNGSGSGNLGTRLEGVTRQDDEPATDVLTSNRNTSQETGRLFRMQDSYPSAFSPQNQEQDLCMFCGKTGHKIEECRLNVQCRMCSKWGHSSGSCPENRIVLKCPICEEDHLGKDCSRFCGELSF